MNAKNLRVFTGTIKNKMSNLQTNGEKMNLKTQIHQVESRQSINKNKKS